MFCEVSLQYSDYRRSPNGISLYNPEDGGINDLQNVGILPQNYTASEPRKPLVTNSME